MTARLPQQIADPVRHAVIANDRAAHWLGIEVVAIAPGPRDDDDDGPRRHAASIWHGGLITTLADTCFAYACHSYDEMTVAAGFSVDLMAPGRLGDLLTAVGVEVSKGGRTGLYDVTVTNQRDERIAVFRGRSHTIKGRPAVSADAAA